MRYFSFARFVSIAVPLLALVSCSNTGTEPQITPQVTFNPRSGSPGTIITITGVDLSNVIPTDLNITIGDQTVPAVADEAGRILTAIPLHLDEDGVPFLPGVPLDLVLRAEAEIVFEAKEAVTVIPLPEAPGAAAALVEAVVGVGESVINIGALLDSEAGVQQQYLNAFTVALDSLLHGSNEIALTAAHAELQSDVDAAAVVGAIVTHTGVLAKMQRYSQLLESLESELLTVSANGIGVHRKGSVNDVSLAKQMQFYVILRDFGRDVLAESAAEIGVVAGLLGIASSHPYVKVVSVVTHYVNFVVNKIAIGYFPADLEKIEISVHDSTIPNGTTTSSDIVVHAVNDPPGMTVLDLTDQILSALGLSSSSGPLDFRTILLKTTSYFLGLMSSTIQAYSQAHPELGLNPDMFSLVPPIKWQAWVTNPVLIDCETFTPSLVTPLDEELEWRASDTAMGEARIYVRPSTSEDAYFFPNALGYEYNAGAFGESMMLSPIVSVMIGRPLVLELTLPSALARGTSGELVVRAGYEGQDGSFEPAPGIHLSVVAEGGTVEATTGISDADGLFSTMVTADDLLATEIVLVVSGSDDSGGQTEQQGAIPVESPSGMVAFLGDGNVGQIIQWFPSPDEHEVVHQSPEQIPYLNENDGPQQVNCLHESALVADLQSGQNLVHAAAGASLGVSCSVVGNAATFELTSHTQAPLHGAYVLAAENGMGCAIRLYNGSTENRLAVLSWNISGATGATPDSFGQVEVTASAHLRRTDCSTDEVGIWRFWGTIEGTSYAATDTLVVVPGASEVLLRADIDALSRPSSYVEDAGAEVRASIQFTVDLLQ